MKEKRYSLNDTIMSFRDGSGKTDISLDRSLRNWLITGSTGAGKSRTSGSLLATNLLRAGCGAVIFCAKENEASRFINICKKIGRSSDIIHMKVGGEQAFDFMKYICQPTYNGRAITSNIVEMLKAVLASDDSSVLSREAYWSNALDELLYSAVNIALLSEQTATVEDLYDIISSVPGSGFPNENLDRVFRQRMQSAKLNVDSEIFSYVDNLPSGDKYRLMDPLIFEREIKQRFSNARTLNSVDRFFFETFKNLSSKTKSVVQSSSSGLLFRLLQEPVYSLFCNGHTTFTPDDVFAGKIILLDIPILSYGKAAQDVQRLFKHCFIQAMKRRPISGDNLPVVAWQDECHLTLLPDDANFLSISREHHVINVFITQNISNLHNNIGGDKADHQVQSILSGLGNKVFHCNDHVATNQMAVSLIGQAYTEDYSFGDTVSGQFSTSRNQSFKLEHMVRPEQFLHLQSASRNSDISEAYVVLQGEPFHDGLHHRKVIFKQQNF